MEARKRYDDKKTLTAELPRIIEQYLHNHLTNISKVKWILKNQTILRA